MSRWFTPAASASDRARSPSSEPAFHSSAAPSAITELSCPVRPSRRVSMRRPYSSEVVLEGEAQLADPHGVPFTGAGLGQLIVHAEPLQPAVDVDEGVLVGQVV